MVNISKELDIHDLSHLSLAYTLAYLQDKNLVIARNEPPIDGHWNFGRFQDSYLLRGNHQQLFSLLNCPVVNSKKEAIQQQTISQNCHQQFIHVLAFFIAQGYSNLPEPNLNLAFCINHDNAHWTTLIAQYQNIDLTAYQNLYRQYWLDRQQAEPLTKNNHTDALTIQMNDVKNYIREKRQERTQAFRLPIGCEQVRLTFHDSLGKQTEYNRNLHLSATQFIKQNNARPFLACIQPQQGYTCGDWSVYAGFRRGLFTNTPSQSYPTSEQLRFFTENTTLRNAKQLMSSSGNSKLWLAAKHKRVTQKTALDDEAISQRISPWLRQLNNSFTLPRIFGKILCAAACTYFIHTYAPLLLTAHLFSGLATGAAIGVVSHVGFTALCSLFFGEKKVALKFNEKYRIKAYNTKGQRGLLNGLGYDCPYHLSLDELNHKIDALLQTKLPNAQERKILTHYFAKKLIHNHPKCFYTDDYLHVHRTHYVNQEKATHLLRTKLY